MDKDCILRLLQCIDTKCDPSEDGRRIEIVKDFIEQQEKYAELGRLALKLGNDYCDHTFNDGYCNRCDCGITMTNFCQKRAELLAEGRE